MSEAEFMEDGADYLEYYGEDCDGDCENCKIRKECEDYERKSLCRHVI